MSDYGFDEAIQPEQTLREAIEAGVDEIDDVEELNMDEFTEVMEELLGFVLTRERLREVVADELEDHQVAEAGTEAEGVALGDYGSGVNRDQVSQLAGRTDGFFERRQRELQAVADETDSLREFADAIGRDPDRASRLTRIYGIGGVGEEPDRYGTGIAGDDSAAAHRDREERVELVADAFERLQERDSAAAARDKATAGEADVDPDEDLGEYGTGVQ